MDEVIFIIDTEQDLTLVALARLEYNRFIELRLDEHETALMEAEFCNEDYED